MITNQRSLSMTKSALTIAIFILRAQHHATMHQHVAYGRLSGKHAMTLRTCEGIPGWPSQS